MALLFNRTETLVKKIYDDFKNSKLIVDETYQRRKVWLPQDKVRLIETVLLELVVPEVFFWPSSLDAETGEMVTHIVDGQQRIRSIVEFISGEFPLADMHLMNESIRQRCSNKYFSQLSDSDKTRVWMHNIAVVNIDPSFSRGDITQMFYRLNLTNYNLNAQERRNSKESAFGDASEALSKLDFWKYCKVFSSADARRMKDVEYCCSIYILANEGVVDQTNSRKINDYYDDYAEVFDEDNVLYNKIEIALKIIMELLDKSTLSFVSKKAQMYSLFSLIFKLLDSDKINVPELSERFKQFVIAYNRFRNEFDISFENGDLRNVNEYIKKYKLASSEGINKLGNRVIRLETLNEICVNSPSEIKGLLKELERIYTQQAIRSEGVEGGESFDSEDLVDINEV